MQNINAKQTFVCDSINNSKITQLDQELTLAEKQMLIAYCIFKSKKLEQSRQNNNQIASTFYLDLDIRYSPKHIPNFINLIYRVSAAYEQFKKSCNDQPKTLENF